MYRTISNGLEIVFFLFWGSFLNMLAYRLIYDKSLLIPRSFCPHCKHTIAWYDLIPVVSWLMLRGKCRHCHKPISVLYPFIELLTPLLLAPLFVTIPAQYLVGYFLFFSALIISIRTDLETLLISRWVSLFAIPAGWVLAGLGLLPITLGQSVVGSFFGYGILQLISWLFWKLSGKEGMGLGDIELLGFIGAFVGPLGAWITLMIGSLLGTVAGTLYWIATKSRKFPFGPFLALGAMTYVLCQKQIIALLFIV